MSAPERRLRALLGLRLQLQLFPRIFFFLR
jgi:hypothetical protein